FIARILLTTETADVELPTPTDTSSLANRDASNIAGADKLAWQDVIGTPIVPITQNGKTGVILKSEIAGGLHAPIGQGAIDFSNQGIQRTTPAGDYSFNSGTDNQ